ncbi:MAG: hypothetical protein NXH72_08055 [Hyphomonadaceae bacterium]|nr:hypothetical protein [Hyphomonadaceae bacterium]
MVALLMPSSFALAEQEAHLIAFTEGRYEEAATLAETTHTADSLAFAARSILADAISNPNYEPPTHLLDLAELKTRAALDLNPDHIEGRLQLAIALSLKARPLSSREAMKTGGKEAKALADAVLADDPGNPYVHGFLAVWHLEVRRRGGSIGASVMGASVRKANEHYQAAISIAPDDASIHWQYARALAALNARKYNQEAVTVLQTALACQSDSTLESVMMERARTLLTSLEQDSRKHAQRLAAKML